MAEKIPTDMGFWAKNGKWLAAVAAVVVGLGYVLQQVNPETVAAWREREAVVSKLRDIRWCLGKAALRNQTAEQALECAD